MVEKLLRGLENRVLQSVSRTKCDKIGALEEGCRVFGDFADKARSVFSVTLDSIDKLKAVDGVLGYSLSDLIVGDIFGGFDVLDLAVVADYVFSRVNSHVSNGVHSPSCREEDVGLADFLRDVVRVSEGNPFPFLVYLRKYGLDVKRDELPAHFAIHSEIFNAIKDSGRYAGLLRIRQLSPSWDYVRKGVVSVEDCDLSSCYDWIERFEALGRKHSSVDLADLEKSYQDLKSL